MKFLVSKSKKDVHIKVVISGADEKVKKEIALEIRKAILKVNRHNEHKNPAKERASYEIAF